nr:DUF3857 and transglutaminase domain-containing protein [Saprospiraceae bacterium]
MRFILFFSMLVLSYSLVAQVKYPASEIPDSLLKNASAVYREYHSTFEVLDKGHAVQKEHVVVTLLNEKAEHLGTPFFQYFELVEIEDLEASVYDGDGHLVRNLKKKDIKDIKPFEEGVNDVRYKVLDLPSRSYPYTIAYKVTTKLNALMFYPSFSPQPSSDIAVQHAGFQIKMPSNLKVRIMELNLPEGSKKAELSWEFNNIPAFRPEPFAPQSEIKLPIVITSPTHFSMGGVDGDMTSWESYGVFMQQLLKSQSAIPAELENKLKNLVADCQTDICKVEKIYSYLQANTRYFYVGYGIGWWQPAPASKVDKYKYGDCKGLSNYMVSMLKAVGIESYYSIIKAGKNEQRQFPDFPNPHFNHVIVNVPLENDTIWLECTSQTESFGFLSDFTDNRPAFAITPEGGKLLRTPKYDETVNTIRRQTDIALQPDGNANLKSVDVFSGIAQNFLSVLEGYNDDLRKKHFYEVLKIGDFEITKLEFTRRRERIPAVVQNIELK